MIIGVTTFAAGTSFLTNLLQNYDNESGKLQEKMMKLDYINREHKLPLKLYENIKRSIRYECNSHADEI